MKRMLIAFILLLVLAAPVQAAYMYTFDYKFSKMVGAVAVDDFWEGEWSFILDELVIDAMVYKEGADLLNVSSTYPYSIEFVAVSVDETYESDSLVTMNFLDDDIDIPFGWKFNMPFNAAGVYDSFPSGWATMTIIEIPAGVPEPLTVVLLGLGLIALAGARRKRRE